jgi:hypothetical protein
MHEVDGLPGVLSGPCGQVVAIERDLRSSKGGIGQLRLGAGWIGPQEVEEVQRLPQSLQADTFPTSVPLYSAGVMRTALFRLRVKLG